MTEEEYLLSLPQTKEMALLKEEVFYFTRKSCNKGHIGPRYTSSSNCVKCIEEKRGIVFNNFRSKSSKRNEENQRLAEESFCRGYTTYTSTKKCPLGHYERYCTTNNCVECDKFSRKERKEKLKWKRIFDTYNLNKEEFFTLLYDQKAKCCICRKKIDENCCHIDHCHKSNFIRGLLCQKCNQALGLFEDNKNSLLKAVEYLNESEYRIKVLSRRRD